MPRFHLAELSPTMQRLNPAARSAALQSGTIPEIGNRLGRSARWLPSSIGNGTTPEPPPRESELQRQCEHELRRRHIAFLHLSPRAREKVGWPDLTFAVYGKAVAVELKTPVGKLSPEQEQLHRELAASGWDVRVIRSFEKFHELVKGIEVEV